MNPTIALIAFALGLAYGRMASKANLPAVVLAGLLMAVLLGNYPYYDMQFISITYASALAGALVGSWRNRSTSSTLKGGV